MINKPRKLAAILERDKATDELDVNRKISRRFCGLFVMWFQIQRRSGVDDIQFSPQTSQCRQDNRGNSMKTIFTTVIALSIFAATALAQWAEPFDSMGTADVLINSEADSAFTYVDYSTILPVPSGANGGLTGIPEAPRMIAGSVPTQGIKLEGNLSLGGASGVNVLAGATPVSFSGNYRISYDAFLKVPNDPSPSGSTEQLLWGVGTDNANVIEARNNRGTGTVGVYGWLASENGYSTEDAAINENDDEVLDVGDTGGPEFPDFPGGGNVPFDTAFPCNFNNPDGGFALPSTPDAPAPNGAAANDWVQVDIDVIDNGDGTSNVGVYYNGVQFFNKPVASTSATGFAMLGYEDPFGSSINSDPANTFGLFDNFVVTQDPGPLAVVAYEHIGCAPVPEPTSVAMIVIGCLALVGVRRRRRR